MQFDLLKVSFSCYWFLPINFHNQEIICWLIWELMNWRRIWYCVNNTFDVGTVIINEVETYSIPLLWYLQFILEYSGVHTGCNREVESTWNDINLDIVLLKKTFCIPLKLQGPCCVLLIRVYMGFILIKPCMVWTVDIILGEVSGKCLGFCKGLRFSKSGFAKFLNYTGHQKWPEISSINQRSVTMIAKKINSVLI